MHRKLAASAGAQFSAEGITQLVAKARSDDLLTESLGMRRDLPVHLQRQLLEAASQTVCEKLLAVAPPSQQEEIRSVLASIGRDVLDELPDPYDFDHANLVVRRIHDNGELDELTLLEFVKSGRYAELVAALAIMCAAPHELVHHIFQSDHNEAFLIPCRAAGLSWSTIRAIAQTRPNGRSISDQDLAQLRSDYSRLSVVTAQRVVRFWCVQRVAGKDLYLP